jgi:selenocysteine lyase/cysteine desulfurase
LAVNLLLGLIANATGVQQNQVSTARLARDLIAKTNKDACQALGFVLIHLAAIGNDYRAFRLHA